MTQPIFRPGGMTRAEQIMRDLTAWHIDLDDEMRELERQVKELEEGAARARAAVLAGDHKRITDMAVIAFNVDTAAIDPDSGDIMVTRPGVAWFLTEVQLCAFIFGFVEPVVTVESAP